jgi:hypothetical protein
MTSDDHQCQELLAKGVLYEDLGDQDLLGEPGACGDSLCTLRYLGYMNYSYSKVQQL